MENKEYWDNGTHLWVTSKDMKTSLINDSMMKISDEALKTMQVYQPGTLLMVTRSGILRRMLPLAILGEKATVNQDLKTISIVAPILPIYVFYAILANESMILRDYHKDGTTVDSINFDKFVEMPIPLPPQNEQKRIVDAIEHYLSLIEDVKHSEDDILVCIDSAKSKILDLAIHGKLVPQDPTDEPASELLKRINPKAIITGDNPHYENIPSTWVCTTIGSIFQHNTGKALNKSTSEEGTLLPYLTTSNVYWNSFDLSVIKEMRFKDSEMDKCTVQKGDLLVCEGGDIGRSAIWNNDYSICIQNHLHRLRPKGGVIPLLYMYYIMHLKRTNNIEGKGIGLQGLSSGMLDKLEIPLPPYNEQKRIVDKIQETFYVLDSITESLN